MDLQNDNSDTITITKNEYATLKNIKENYFKIQSTDFAIIINRSAILPISHPSYYKNRVLIQFFDMNDQKNEIEGKSYTIKSQVLFNKIKEFISDNLEKLVEYSKDENNQFIRENNYKGGVTKSIKIKYGQLLISINGQVNGEIGKYVDEFISHLKDLIINEADKATPEA